MIPYHLYLYDEDFDIFKGKLPIVIESGFGDQLERVREILKQRNLSEISYGLDSLNWMLKKGGELEFRHSMKLLETKELSYVSRVKALKHFAEQIDISEQTDFPNAKWSDYFALLALAYVLESLHPGNSGVNNLDDHVFDGRYPYQLDSPIECMDAICTAENHSILEKTTPVNKDVMSERGKKGGQIRVAKFNELKIKLIQYYLENYTNRSNREAAKRIVKDLHEEITSVLSTDDPAITIAIWIGQYKKGKITI